MMRLNNEICILIVDDEEDIRIFLSYNLRKEGYRVAAAANGIQALEIAKAEKPNLIILDIMMPEMNGIEVCNALRQNPIFKETIIAFLTANNEDFTQVKALDAGGDDYIEKPIRPVVFISRIKALLRRLERNDAATEHQEIIKFGDFVIDRPKVQVSIGTEMIDLPRKEFEILSLLASKPGKVFTREEIFLKIWGEEVIVGNRTIDVHIRKLREKVGENIVKTIKGIGYKFDL